MEPRVEERESTEKHRGQGVRGGNQSVPTEMDRPLIFAGPIIIGLGRKEKSYQAYALTVLTGRPKCGETARGGKTPLSRKQGESI